MSSRTAAGAHKSLSVSAIDSALADAEVFYYRLKLFEKAANQDALQVGSNTLKLQFQESLDEELFRAFGKIHKHLAM